MIDNGNAIVLARGFIQRGLENGMDNNSKNKKFLWFVLTHIDDIVGCAGLTLTLAVVTVNVFMRYFASISMPWVEEIATLGFAYTIFMGAASVYKRHSHIGIDVIVNLLPRRIEKSLNFLMNVFVLLFSVFVVYLGWINAVEAWEKPTAYLKIPYFFVNIAIPIGFAFISGYATRDLCMLIKGKEREDGFVDGDTTKINAEGIQ